MPRNEERRKVKSSREASSSLLDAILEGNRSVAEATERMQQGFSQMVETDRRVEKGLEAILSAMEAFQATGGTMTQTGMTGGSVMFTQLVEASVDGIVDGVKDALGGFFNEDRRAIKAVEKATVENNGVIREAVSRTRSDRAISRAADFRGEPESFSEVKQYLRRFEATLKNATAEVVVNRDTGEREHRTVSDIASNLTEVHASLTEMSEELDSSIDDVRSSMFEELDKISYLNEFLNTLGDDLNDAEAADIERQIEESERRFEYYERMLESGSDTREELSAQLENVRGAIDSIDAYQSGGLTSMLDALGDSRLLQRGSISRQAGGILDSIGGEGGLADVLGRFRGTEGASTALRSIAGKLAPALVALTAIEMGVNAIGGLIAENQKMNEKQIQMLGERGGVVDNIILGASLAGEQKFDAFINGLDERTIQQTQDSLMNRGIEFRSAEYDEGYNFAIRAKRDYNMDASKSIELFSKAVIQGEQSMDDLNDVMEELSKTVQDSRASMQEATESYVNNLNKLEKATGSPELAANITEEIQKEFSGNEQLQNMVTQVVAKAQASDDYFYEERIVSLQEQGLSYEEAAIKAAVDMASEQGGAYGVKWGLYSYKDDLGAMFTTGVDEQGRSLWEIATQGEEGELEDAMRRVLAGEAPLKGPQAYKFTRSEGQTKSTWDSAMSQLGVDFENVEREEGESVAEALLGDMSKGIGRTESFQSATSGVDSVEMYGDLEGRKGLLSIWDQTSDEVATHLGATAGTGKYSEDDFKYVIKELSKARMVDSSEAERLENMDESQRQAFMEKVLASYAEESGVENRVSEAAEKNLVAMSTDARVPGKGEAASYVDWYRGSGFESDYMDFGEWSRTTSAFDAYREALESASAESRYAKDEDKEWKGRFVLERGEEGIMAIVDAALNDRSLNNDATPDTARR